MDTVFSTWILMYIDNVAEILKYHVVAHTEWRAGLYERELLRTIDSFQDSIRVHVEGGNVTRVTVSYCIP